MLEGCHLTENSFFNMIKKDKSKNVIDIFKAWKRVKCQTVPSLINISFMCQEPTASM